MSYYENLGKRALITQLYLVAYSAVAAIVGRGKLLWLVILLFIVVMVVFQSRTSKGPLGHARAKPEDLLASRKLYEEDNLREVQMKDEGLLHELQEQSRVSMYMSVSMIIALAYFFLLWNRIPAIEEYLESHYGLSGRLGLFIAFLLYFEGYFIITQAATVLALRKAGKIPVINMPQKFTITEKGIVLHGVVGKSAVPFPLPEDAKLRVDEKRRFVEIVREGRRSVTKLRLYTRRPRRVYDLISRLNERARSR